MTSVEEIVKKIGEKSGKSADEIKKMISEKQDELSGLVSEEGAAYIVGRELGVSLLKETERRLKVKNIVPGLRSLDLTARVARIFDVREFEREGKKGKVLNLLVGDETGTVRLSLWNEEVDRWKELKEGDVIRISGGWIKSDNRGQPELRIGKGRMDKADEEVELPAMPSTEKLQDLAVAKRKDISELKEGDFGEIRASLIQIFRRNPFYRVCPTCGGKIMEQDGKVTCKEHGEVEPGFQMVLSGIVDDGTGNIRATFFRELAEKLFGKPVKELRDMAMKETDPLNIYEQFTGLGKEFVLRGRVKRNSYTENLEFMVNDLEEADVKREAEQLVKELSA